MLKSILTGCLMISCLGIVVAQTSRDIESPSFSSAKNTGLKKQFVVHEYTFKHRYDDYYDQLIVEYEERMIANAKKYKKIARLMKKPQYSDPSYFGHKRKPKKRAVGKRKYCKECEIVH